MSRIQHFFMPEPAKRALSLIRLKHTFSECALVQTNLYCGSGVPSAKVVRTGVRRDRCGGLGKPYVLGIVHSNGKGQLRRIISDNEYRPRCEVFAWYETMEVDERLSFRHQSPQANVVSMSGVGATVTITKQPGRAHCVVVRTSRSGCYGEWSIGQKLWLEYSLWSE